MGEIQISRYESGRGEPSATYLARIAQELNVSADYLLGLSDKTHGQLNDTGLSDIEIRQLRADPNLTEILRMFAGLPQEIQDAILAIVRSQKAGSKTH